MALAPGDRGAASRVDGALEDLRAGRLRVLHERSFRDDPTRLWRLARYAARLGFAVERADARAGAAAVAGGALDAVCGAAHRQRAAPRAAPSPIRVAALRAGRADLGLAPWLAPDADARSAAALALLPQDEAAGTSCARWRRACPGTTPALLPGWTTGLRGRASATVVAAASRAVARGGPLRRRARPSELAARRARRAGRGGRAGRRAGRRTKRGAGWRRCAMCAWRSPATT